MPRKAYLAGVVFTGLLLAGCEWCGNCKSFCGGSPGSYYASTPGATTGSRMGSMQTPSSVAANPSSNQKSNSGVAIQRSGLVPAKDDSYSPSTRPFDSNVEQAQFPLGSTRPTVGVLQGNAAADSDAPPPPEDPVSPVAPADAGPTLQAPTRTPSFRPQQ